MVISWIAYGLLQKHQVNGQQPMLSFDAFVFGGSVFFAVVTVILSILIDRRLRMLAPADRLFSLRAGVVTALACVLFDEAFRVVLAQLGQAMPGHHAGLLLGPLGFVLGCFVPGVAYAYLVGPRTFDENELGPRSSAGLLQESALHQVAP